MAHKRKQDYNGGCPTLSEQAVNRHEETELRINLEMGRLGLEAIKKFKAMFKDWDNLKENTKLAVLDRVFKYNKDFLKEHRELLLGGSKQEEVEEDYEIGIELTSEETESQRLN